MKLLFVARSTSAHAGSGGMERGYEEVAGQLAGRGHRVAVLTTPLARGAAGSLGEMFEQHWQIEGAVPGRYSSRWWSGSADRRADWRSWKPDVIFSVSRAGAAMADVRATMVAQCHGTARAEMRSSAAAMTPRELAKIPLNAARQLSERAFYRSVAKTIAIGDAVGEQLQAAPIRLPASKITTIPNGVSPAGFAFSSESRALIRAQLLIAPETSVAITTSRLHVQKGVDVAIRALGMQGPGAQLIVCGDGPEKASLERLARDLGVVDRVHFTGRQPTDALSNYMSAADVLLFPTRRREGLPLGLLEAAANGLSIVTVENAQVAQDLRPAVTVTSGSASAVAHSWLNSAPRSAMSRLPIRYHLKTAIDAYEQTLLSVPSMP